MARFRHIPIDKIPFLKEKFLGFADFDDRFLILSGLSDINEISQFYPEFNYDSALNTRRELWEGIKEKNVLEKLLTYEQKTYLAELLLRQDKMSMAHGIENRVPFLDHRVVEFSKTLKTEEKIKVPVIHRRGRASAYTKRILKEISRSHFGNAFTYRVKSGFSMPIDELFTQRAFALMIEDLKPIFRLLGIGNVSALVQKRRASSAFLWTLLSLAVWWKVFVQEKGNRMQKEKTSSVQAVHVNPHGKSSMRIA
jgi:asparagine synthase (glutamine-hydrolysing)